MPVSLKPLGLAIALVLLAACNQAPPAAEAAEVDATAPAATEATAPAMEAHDASAAPVAVPAPQLQAAMRDLWHGHIVHARDYALAVHAGDDDRATAAADAVVENAKQISASIWSPPASP